MLNGRVFDPEIAEKFGMKEMPEMVEFQKWSHLFRLAVPSMFEEEVINFYKSMIAIDDSLLASVNGTQGHPNTAIPKGKEARPHSLSQNDEP
ncbi:hypothetical protein RND71_026687 [Anisodus tanguticus]|uniref:Uncharacterized protein n=1 Tax=Anisodus tanguticus TaxID=243964 RepID=A0AAE1RMN3_9SOLA|nr:hypothetical protein RND71_026687 [Anisodus tanguticus]